VLPVNGSSQQWQWKGLSLLGTEASVHPPNQPANDIQIYAEADPDTEGRSYMFPATLVLPVYAYIQHKDITMDLKDFISTSLTQIAEGILAASEALKDTDAVVNPTQLVTHSNSAQGFGRTLKADDATYLSVTRLVERVTFDVAVTTEGSTQGSAGLKVGIGSVGIKVGGDMQDKAGQESRIQFTIPMVFPSTRTTP
jgi:hypothetical protein